MRLKAEVDDYSCLRHQIEEPWYTDGSPHQRLLYALVVQDCRYAEFLYNLFARGYSLLITEV